MDRVHVRRISPSERRILHRLKRQRRNTVNCNHARTILLSSGRVNNREIAQRVGYSPQWVRKIIHRFNRSGVGAIQWYPYWQSISSSMVLSGGQVGVGRAWKTSAADGADFSVFRLQSPWRFPLAAVVNQQLKPDRAFVCSGPAADKAILLQHPDRRREVRKGVGNHRSQTRIRLDPCQETTQGLSGVAPALELVEKRIADHDGAAVVWQAAGTN